MKKSDVNKRFLFLLVGLVLLISIVASMSLVSAQTYGELKVGDTLNGQQIIDIKDLGGTQVYVYFTGQDVNDITQATVYDKSWTIPSTTTTTSTKAAPGSNVDPAREANATATLKKGGVLCSEIENVWWNEKCAIWLGGWDNSKLGPSQINIMGQMIKWIMLILVILMIYSALHEIEWPKGTAMQIIIAIIVGFLATFLITTSELLTLMQGYSAAGVALIVFLPFFILGGFTLVVARSLSPIGIYFQKILWVIFSVFLVLKTFVLWLILDHMGKATLKVGEAINVTFFQINVTQGLLNMSQNTDRSMLITLTVAAIVAVVIMLGDNVILKWAAKEDLDAAILAEKGILNKSRARDVLHAQDLEKGSKT